MTGLISLHVRHLQLYSFAGVKVATCVLVSCTQSLNIPIDRATDRVVQYNIYSAGDLVLLSDLIPGT